MYEHVEFVLAIILTVVLTLCDILLLLARDESAHITKPELLHDVLRGFILSLVASFSLSVLIRWYRHKDELLEAFGHFRQLDRYPDVREALNEISTLAISVKSKHWPQHASDYLIEQLEELRSFARTLDSGKLDPVPYDVAFEHEQNMFKRTRGSVFVTCYGPMDWWSDEAGRKLLASNEATIRNGGKVVRLFILPPYKNGGHIALPADFADIIARHRRVGVTVLFAVGCDLDVEVRDLAIFYKTTSANDIEFVSEWLPYYNVGGKHDYYAVWYFNDGEFNTFRRLRQRLMDESALIDSDETLNKHIAALRSRGVQFLPIAPRQLEPT